MTASASSPGCRSSRTFHSRSSPSSRAVLVTVERAPGEALWRQGEEADGLHVIAKRPRTGLGAAPRRARGRARDARGGRGAGRDSPPRRGHADGDRAGGGADGRALPQPCRLRRRSSPDSIRPRSRSSGASRRSPASDYVPATPPWPRRSGQGRPAGASSPREPEPELPASADARSRVPAPAPVLPRIRSSALVEIFDSGRLAFLPVGHVILGEGAAGGGLLRHPRRRCRGGDRRGDRAIRVGLAGPGRAFGYLGLIDGGASPVTATTRERTLLLALGRCAVRRRCSTARRSARTRSSRPSSAIS